MSARCPHCGQALPGMVLPVCAHCGGRLEQTGAAEAAVQAPELTLPVTGYETAAELADRFFDPPVVYTLPFGIYLLQVLVACPVFAAPLLYRYFRDSQVSAVLLGLLAALGLVLTVYVAMARRPSRLAVILDRRGVRHRGRCHHWESVHGCRAIAPTKRRTGWPHSLDVMQAFRAKTRDRWRTEPDAVGIQLRDGQTVRIARELTGTASIRSLRNLQGLVELLVAALGREGETDDHP